MWDTPASANGAYDYSQVLQDDVVVLNTTDRTANLEGLESFRAYQFRVRSINVGGYVGYLSNQLSVKTEQGRPSAPMAITACGVNTTTMAVGWIEPTKTNGILESYKVTLSLSSPDGACSPEGKELRTVMPPASAKFVLFPDVEVRVYQTRKNACVRVRVRVHVCVCVHVHVRVHGSARINVICLVSCLMMQF